MTDARFVLSARVVGSVHRDSPKLKMFMVSVLWSDEAEVIIYRSFKDFKTFHGELKKRFPNLNPFKKNDRLIPKFRGKARKSSLPQKGSKKSVKRMKFLETYCDKLMKCAPNVTQSTEVSRFFNPKDRDVQPDFTKNSVVVLLSEDLSGPGGSATLQPAGNVTHPFVTQTYRSVAPYETKDTKNRPFKVAKDEKVDVLIKDPTGWWLVENEDKRLAWFPAPYLELWEGEEDDSEDVFPPGGALYCAVRSYSTTNADEVSVSIGSVVEVLRKSDNGWWLIRFNGKAGYIPSMYLQPYNNPRAGVHSVQRKLHSSTLNLATSRSSRSSYAPGAGEESGPEDVFPSPSRLEPGAIGHLHKARSLDVLSEPWKQPLQQRASPAAEGDSRRMSSTSAETSFSDFSLSSEDSLSQRREAQSQSQPESHRPSLGFASNPGFKTSTDSSESISSAGQTLTATPKVPPRPKTEEILTRCTTLTRKAALATKTRLQLPSDGVHSR